jgi:GT2 family glycosyltransferase
MKTPVVLIIYNRPEQTKLVFEAIKKNEPTTLYIFADGGKNAEDSILCKEAQSVIDSVNWGVELKVNISDKNMGCVPRIISALNEVFERERTAIILEDDCLPHPTFFNYCTSLLDYYIRDENIMHISGCNILQQVNSTGTSYFFSNYALPSWGWATWARAWKKFNPNLDTWQKHKKEIYHHISQENFSKWTDTFEYIRINKVGWDIPWNIDIWANKGLNIMPYQNLVKNIGFDETATFTKNKLSCFADLIVHEMKFPLIHPENKKTLFDKELEAANIQLLKDMD